MKNKGGRKTVITESVILKLESAFALGCSDLEACLMANIGKSTLYKYQDEHPEFSERKAELKETTILEARESVRRGIKEDPVLALKYLERKRSKEFGTHSTVDSNVMINPEAEAFYNKRANEKN